MDESIELLVTVVVAAEGEEAARDACEQLCWHVEGRIVDSADCSAEEPGCWSVTIAVPTDERATYNVGAPLARAVRRFVRSLGPNQTLPRVSCEPPTAWTVLDEPETLTELVPGAERVLIEAWCGADPYRMREREPEPGPVAEQADQPAHQWIPPEDKATEDGYRLILRVDVATTRHAGAEWQARAVASRISGAATLTGMTERDGVLSVHVDLGPAPSSAPQTVLNAVSALDRGGWTPLRWEGDTAITSWIADPIPSSGITALELSSGPAPAPAAEAQ
ncbi:MAG TPA: hypothetical protein VGJ45_04480 [Pseudonocardiaceae bacterium]|jgi:hypothetical protein